MGKKLNTSDLRVGNEFFDMTPEHEPKRKN